MTVRCLQPLPERLSPYDPNKTKLEDNSSALSVQWLSRAGNCKVGRPFSPRRDFSLTTIGVDYHGSKMYNGGTEQVQ